MSYLGKNFSIIHRYMGMFMSRELEGYGITRRTAPYYDVICKNPGISQEEIAKELKMDKGAVARCISILLEEKKIKRELNPKDRREYRIYPAPEMEEGYRALCQASDKIREIATRGMSREEIAVCEKVIEKMADNISGEMKGRNR